MDYSSIDPFKLPSVALPIRERLEYVSCIYFVHDGQAVLYVGQTDNLFQRWSSHDKFGRTRGKELEGLYLSWMSCPLDDLNEAEKFFYYKYSPPLNSSRFIPHQRRVQPARKSVVWKFSTEAEARLFCDEQLHYIIASLKEQNATDAAIDINGRIVHIPLATLEVAAQ